MEKEEQIEFLRQAVFDDIFSYIGLSSQSLRRRFLEMVVSPPINRFVTIVTEFYQKVGEVGLVEAARWFLSQYARQVESHGNESIPREGPLLIVSNHPGYYDGLAIAANLPRTDLKMVAGNYPIINGLEYFNEHLILTAKDLNSRMLAIRGAIRQLMEGGSLLIFPTGKVDPDPDVMPGAAESLQAWSPSIELFLKKVPQAQVLVTIVSGVVAPASMHHPLTHLKKLPNERQRIAEFVQICQQALWPKKPFLVPKVSYARPFTAEEVYRQSESVDLTQEIIARAQQLLNMHVGHYQLPEWVPVTEPEVAGG